MHRTPLSTIIGAGLALGLVATPAVAFDQVTFFQDREAFEADLGSSGAREGFEDLPVNEIAGTATFASGLRAGLLNGNIDMYVGIAAYDYINTTPDGSNVLFFGGPGSTGTYTVRFLLRDAAHGFGFDISGWNPLQSSGGGGGGMNISLLAGGQMVAERFLPSDSRGDLLFIGLASTVEFDEVRMNISQLGQLPNIPYADHATFDEVTWIVPEGACPADFDESGELDLFDIIAFFAAFGANDPAADINDDAAFDLFDILSFFDAFSAGCP